jgi:hypothetical protein
MEVMLFVAFEFNFLVGVDCDVPTIYIPSCVELPLLPICHFFTLSLGYLLWFVHQFSLSHDAKSVFNSDYGKILVIKSATV